MEHGHLRQVVGNVVELRRNGRRSPAEIAARQHERLATLVRFARERSPFYHERYSRLPAGVPALPHLPVVTKRELMERFDEWVTDPEVKRADVEKFLADPTRVGHPYLGRYGVWTSTGITGRRGVFVHDEGAQAVYTALVMARPSRHIRTLLQGGRLATLVTPGHFALTSFLEGLRRRCPLLAGAMRPFSALEPLPDLVRELDAFRPNSLIGCPTVLQLLAEARQAGRLSIDPRLVTTEGEWLSPATRRFIEEAFHCTVRDTYGASEFLVMASDCGQGWCHLNSEWVVLEPVDDAFLPVPPGQASHTVLLTNLANRVQPLLRYDLGDSVTVRPDPCSCGSPYPAIRVEGRRDEILYLPDAAGRLVPLLPLAFISVCEETPGVNSFQIIQEGPTTLRFRLETEVGADRASIWEDLRRRLQDYLEGQSVSTITLELAPQGPQRDPVSGKFCQVLVQSPTGNNVTQPEQAEKMFPK